MFSADIVWGCAVAVDRINNGYCKEDEWNRNTDCHFISKQANKKAVKRMLATNDYHDVTEADIERGKELRHYFNGYLLREVAGKINDFEKQALRIAQLDEFTNRNLLQFAIISCLPSSFRREEKKKKLDNAIWHSCPLVGSVGDYIQSDIEIVKCYFNSNYDKYRITARLGDSFVYFWFKQGFSVGEVVKVKGRIKTKRPDNTTQFHYVKLK